MFLGIIALALLGIGGIRLVIMIRNAGKVY